MPSVYIAIIAPDMKRIDRLDTGIVQVTEAHKSR
jgi:hypothetical protein